MTAVDGAQWDFLWTLDDSKGETYHLIEVQARP